MSLDMMLMHVIMLCHGISCHVMLAYISRMSSIINTLTNLDMFVKVMKLPPPKNSGHITVHKTPTASIGATSLDKSRLVGPWCPQMDRFYLFPTNPGQGDKECPAVHLPGFVPRICSSRWWMTRMFLGFFQIILKYAALWPSIPHITEYGYNHCSMLTTVFIHLFKPSYDFTEFKAAVCLHLFFT